MRCSVFRVTIGIFRRQRMGASHTDSAARIHQTELIHVSSLNQFLSFYSTITQHLYLFVTKLISVCMEYDKDDAGGLLHHCHMTTSNR